MSKINAETLRRWASWAGDLDAEAERDLNDAAAALDHLARLEAAARDTIAWLNGKLTQRDRDQATVLSAALDDAPAAKQVELEIHTGEFAVADGRVVDQRAAKQAECTCTVETWDDEILRDPSCPKHGSGGEAKR